MRSRTLLSTTKEQANYKKCSADGACFLLSLTKRCHLLSTSYNAMAETFSELPTSSKFKRKYKRIKLKVRVLPNSGSKRQKCGCVNSAAQDKKVPTLL